MSNSAQITLRQGERVFINGSVMRADRRVTLELLNDVPYILERHIMQVEQTTTPLRQLYFVVQTMILDPAGSAQAREVFDGSMKWMLETYSNRQIRTGLAEIRENVEQGRAVAGLAAIRSLMPVEDAILGITRHTEFRYLEAV